MPLTRRRFLDLAARGIAAGALAPAFAARAGSQQRIKAIAFDAFPVFDPRPAFALAERLFPGHGAELSNAWRTRLFEYQWLRVLNGRYADFEQTLDDALAFAAEQSKLDLSADKRAQLLDAWLALKAWPDAPQALASLRSAGFRLAFLSNMTARMLQAGIRNAGLDGVFEHVLSTDAVRSFKPDPRAYRLGVEAFGLRKEEILFVSFAGWDAAGAKSFGYPTYWVNRAGAPAERLGVAADGVGGNLADLVAFLRA
ncbi:MAG TPA: haloacid dehalogenase type II [Mizugakiibacter sp.]